MDPGFVLRGRHQVTLSHPALENLTYKELQAPLLLQNKTYDRLQENFLSLPPETYKPTDDFKVKGE
jgi:hypothetical protein